MNRKFLLSTLARPAPIGLVLSLMLTACTSSSGVRMTPPGQKTVEITPATEQQLPSGELSFRIAPLDVLQVDVYPRRGELAARKAEYTNEIHLELAFRDQSYRVAPGDVLGIELASESDKVYEVSVLPSGTIRLPRIGTEVMALGQTPAELTATLNREYAVLFRNPRVSVNLQKSCLDQLQRLSGNYTVDWDGQIVVPLLGSIKAVGLNAKEISAAVAEQAKGYFQNRIEVVASILPLSSRQQDTRLAPDGQQYFRNTVKVAPDGSIFIPDAGTFTVTNKTLAEVNEDIQRAFDRVYQNQVQVRVALQESTNMTVFVGGEVKQPGRYPFSNSLTLLQVISSAGWVSEDADIANVTLLHATEGNNYVVYSSNLLETVNGKARLRQDLKLSPRDIVLVPKTGVAKGNLWVEQYIRGLLPFGMTLNYTFVTNTDNLTP